MVPASRERALATSLFTNFGGGSITNYDYDDDYADDDVDEHDEKMTIGMWSSRSPSALPFPLSMGNERGARPA